MDFIHFLSSHMLDPTVGGKRLYKSVVAQAVHAERLGYRGVGIPRAPSSQHPSDPVAAADGSQGGGAYREPPADDSVCQLPLRDMRIFAGEVVQAQALCDGRLMLGVGKGAFAYETDRIGVPFGETKQRFEKNLKILEALLTPRRVVGQCALSLCAAHNHAAS